MQHLLSVTRGLLLLQLLLRTARGWPSSAARPGSHRGRLLPGPFQKRACAPALELKNKKSEQEPPSPAPAGIHQILTEPADKRDPSTDLGSVWAEAAGPQLQAPAVGELFPGLPAAAARPHKPRVPPGLSQEPKAPRTGNHLPFSKVFHSWPFYIYFSLRAFSLLQCLPRSTLTPKADSQFCG